jgi:RNA polymerase sigma factor (sigma-70 family)
MMYQRAALELVRPHELGQALAVEFHGTLPDFPILWEWCLRYFRRRRPPPHWTTVDWQEVVGAEAALAALAAKRDFDPQRGPMLRDFVQWRMWHAVKSRYRKECAAGRRCAVGPIEAIQPAPDDTASPSRLQAVEAALRALPPGNREFLRLHFAEELKEAALARRLGVSQAAVSRRKRQIIEDLKGILGNA